MYDIIINPASKSGRGINIWRMIEPVLNDKGIEYKSYFTDRIGDAIKLSEKITSDGAEHKIIILGGDGTVNEVFQGIYDFDKVTIGYIPTGSSNDLARDLRLTKKPLERLEQILSEKNVVLKDIGELTYNSYETKDALIDLKNFKPVRRFSVSAGIGFDAAVCATISNSSLKKVLNKVRLGKLIYLATALKQLIKAKREWCEHTIDDKPAVKFARTLFIASMIHRYEGGGFMFCPHASYNDGLLDLCVAGDISLPKILIALPTAFFGKHFKFNNIYELRGQKINIKTAVPLWVHTDGEVEVKADDISICCDKYRVKFIL